MRYFLLFGIVFLSMWFGFDVGWRIYRWNVRKRILDLCWTFKHSAEEANNIANYLLRW